MATAHNPAVSPLGFLTTNLYAPLSFGLALSMLSLTVPSGSKVVLILSSSGDMGTPSLYQATYKENAF